MKFKFHEISRLEISDFDFSAPIVREHCRAECAHRSTQNQSLPAPEGNGPAARPHQAQDGRRQADALMHWLDHVAVVVLISATWMMPDGLMDA